MQKQTCERCNGKKNDRLPKHCQVSGPVGEQTQGINPIRKPSEMSTFVLLHPRTSELCYRLFPPSKRSSFVRKGLCMCFRKTIAFMLFLLFPSATAVLANGEPDDGPELKIRPETLFFRQPGSTPLFY